MKFAITSVAFAISDNYCSDAQDAPRLCPLKCSIQQAEIVTGTNSLVVGAINHDEQRIDNPEGVVCVRVVQGRGTRRQQGIHGHEDASDQWQ